MGAPYIYIYDISRLRVKRYLSCYFNGTVILNKKGNNFTGMCGVTMQATYDSTKDEVAM